MRNIDLRLQGEEEVEAGERSRVSIALPVTVLELLSVHLLFVSTRT